MQQKLLENIRFNNTKVGMITFKLFILEFFNDNAGPVPTLPPLELSRSLVNFNGSSHPGWGGQPLPARHNGRVTQAVTLITRDTREQTSDE